MKLKERLTEKVIDKLKTDPKADQLFWDGSQRGFGLRITAGGVRSFVYQYTINDRSRRFTIGEYPAWSATAARDKANELRTLIDKGVDPLLEKEQRRQAPTVGQLCDDYLEQHARKTKREKSVKEDESMIKRIIKPRLGSRKIADVSVGDIETIHRSLKKTPYRANRVLSLLSTMFNFSATHGGRLDNPCKKVARYDEHSRERWLTAEELQRLGDALKNYSDQRIANALWLLILTGARRNEVLTAKWSDIDTERKVWIKPAHTTKQKKIEHVPLSAAAVSLIADMKSKAEEEAVYLFPGNVGGQPLQSINKAWTTIRDKADIKGTRLHDLRHTYASHLVSRGVSLPIVGKLLGHTQARTTQRYAHVSDAAQRGATNLIGALVSPALAAPTI